VVTLFGKVNVRPISRKLLALSSAVGLAVNTACYTYVPHSSGDAPLMADVRVTLNQGGTEALTRFLGPRVRAADGKVASINADGDMAIVVRSVHLVNGIRQPWAGEGLVTFPTAHVASVEVSTLDRRKSYAGAAVAVTVFALAAVALMKGRSGNSQADSSTDGGPLTSRSPLFLFQR
jgi:hypothetical protein